MSLSADYMKWIFLIILVTSSSILSLSGQEVKRSDLRGTYTRSDGEPGRTIKKSDSSYVSLSPVTNYVKTLKLKPFGRASEITKAYAMGFDSKEKGTWTLKNDTLLLHLNLSEEQEKYWIDHSRENVIYLISKKGGRWSFTKED